MALSRFFNFLVGIALTLGIWVASLAGLFSLPNGLLYDYFLLLAAQDGISSQVLVVLARYDTINSGDDVWLRALENLQELGARQVIFTFLPTKVSRSFYETAAKPNVLFGRQKIREPEDWNISRFEAVPSQAQGLELQLGSLAIPDAIHGINRQEQTSWSVGARKLESVVLMAARERLGDLPNLGQDFPINFSGRPGGMPKTDISAVLNRTLVGEIVQGKSVLIGFYIPERFSGVRTPFNPDSPCMLPVEYHGFALDTLVSGRTISWLGALPTLILIALVISLGLFAYELLSPRFATAVVVAFIVLWFFGAGALLLFGRIWIPLGEIVIAQMFFLVAMAWQRSEKRSQKVREFILDKSARAMAWSVPGSVLVSQDHWNQLLNMVNQTLPIGKTIFLEKVSGDHRVKEVAALNTALSDIDERRRDYERIPYVTAIERGIPTRVTKFFKSASTEEEQFLVPLSFGGSLLGFWAFTVKPDQLVELPKLLSVVSMFAAQFGEQLYRKREWNESQKLQEGGLKRVFGLKKHRDLLDHMVDLVALLELRLALLESALEANASACMLCDLFGTVLAMNGKMKDLCDRSNLIPYQLSALDVVAKLSGKSQTEVRAIVNRALMENDTPSIPVTMTVIDIETHFLMTISALKSQGTRGLYQEDHEHLPFDTYGLLIQMQEVSERVDIARFKEVILKRGAVRLQEELGSLVETINLTQSEAKLSAGMDELFQKIASSRAALAASIEELGSYVEKDEFGLTLDYYPVDSVEPVAAAIVSLKQDATNRGIAIEVAGPSSATLVRAMPTELGQLMNALLGILVNDAYENTQVSVKIDLHGTEVLYEMANNGFGMPDEDFQRFMQIPNLSGSEHFETIGRLRSKLALWNAELTGSSEVGAGIRFTLRMIRSLLSS